MSKQAEPKTGAAAEAIPDCPHCHKPLPLCICDSITPIENRISLLILQHPQEQDRALGTARLTALHFKNAVLKIGLSWPSLSKALGRPVARSLALGGALSRLRQGRRSRHRCARSSRSTARARSRTTSAPSSKDIEGIVLLDGTWSQAKALWWRNAWMLKCQRVILGPKHPSRYGKLRREPRRDGLSTIEAAAMLLAGLEKRPGYRRDAAWQFRADAGEISRGASHAARTRAETAAEAGLSPPQAGLTAALQAKAPDPVAKTRQI